MEQQINPAIKADETTISIASEIKTKVFRIAASSTSHGISNMVRTEHPHMKVIWLLSLSVSAAFCFYLEIESILTYLGYPVTTKIRYVK